MAIAVITFALVGPDTVVVATAALAGVAVVGISDATQQFSHVGTHALVDFWGVAPDKLTNVFWVESTLRDAAREANATVLSCTLHQFGGHQGLTGVLLLAESHISIHTWPEDGFAALDVYLCGTGQIDACLDKIRQSFLPTREVVRMVVRG